MSLMSSETLNLHTSRGATTGVVARADSKAAVILIHEWWGINDHVRDIANRYAKEGFTCVAPDLYRGKTATDQQEASRLMQELSTEDGLETIAATIEEVKRSIQPDKIGITGYCMGGTFAMRGACEFSQLGAAAPFYGDIPEEDVLRRLKVPTIFIAGTRDAWINTEKVNALKQGAQKYNLPLEVISYDADHAFFNDTRPEVYNPEAAADAWQRVLGHFRKQLGAAAVGSGG